jgi:hypothetical protein
MGRAARANLLAARAECDGDCRREKKLTELVPYLLATDGTHYYVCTMCKPAFEREFIGQPIRPCQCERCLTTTK